MSEIKNILGIIATILVFIGYIPYLRDVIKGQTKPHIYSWFLWSFVTLIAFALQYSHGAGSGSLVTLAAGLMCLVVMVLSLWLKNKVKIVKTDTVFLILALIALGFWLIAEQPFVSIVLVTLIDFLAFVPTVRKSWHQPHSETLSFYYLNSCRFGVAVIALQKYSVITALYPVVWLLANSLFAVLLIVRRKQIKI